MILVGQYDSPFVRRVAVALGHYGLAYDHRPLSVFADEAAVAALNPLVRVPILILDDGEILTDSHVILDHLDRMAPAGAALLPPGGTERRRVQQVLALATGLGDKAVALFYEGRMHKGPAGDWAARLQRQILAALAALEADRAQRPGPFWFGPMTHADIAAACVLGFVRGALPGLLRPQAHSALLAHAEAMEALPLFARVFQPIVPPRD